MGDSGLTPARMRVLRYIAEPPTVPPRALVTQAMGWKSRNSVSEVFSWLSANGYIVKIRRGKWAVTDLGRTAVRRHAEGVGP